MFTAVLANVCLVCRKVAERERESLIAERDLRNSSQRTLENDIYALQFKAQELQSKVKERKGLAETIVNSKNEVASLQEKIKVTLAANTNPIVRVTKHALS